MAAGNVHSILTLGLSSGIPQCIVLTGQIAGQNAGGAEWMCVHWKCQSPLQGHMLTLTFSVSRTSLLMDNLRGKYPSVPGVKTVVLAGRAGLKIGSHLSDRPGWTQTCVSKFMSTSKMVFTFLSGPERKLFRISRQLSYFRIKHVYKERVAEWISQCWAKAGQSQCAHTIYIQHNCLFIKACLPHPVVEQGQIHDSKKRLFISCWYICRYDNQSFIFIFS